MLFVCEIVQGILQVEFERFGIVMMFLLFFFFFFFAFEFLNLRQVGSTKLLLKQRR